MKESTIAIAMLTLIALVELYYWLWWLPRHGKNNAQVRELAQVLRTLYGPRGLVARLMRRGQL